MRRLLVPLTLGALVVSCTRSLELPPPPSNDPGQIQGLVQTTLPACPQEQVLQPSVDGKVSPGL